MRYISVFSAHDDQHQSAKHWAKNRQIGL